MRAGRLRKRLTIQQPTEGSADPLGEKPMTWSDVASVWAEVLPQSGREFYRAQQIHAELSHAISIRYRAGLTPRMRLVLEGRPLNVVAIINVEERNRELLLYCAEEI